MGGLVEEIERLQRENAAHAAILKVAVGRVVERMGRERGSAEHLRELLVRLEPYVDVARLPADLLDDLRRALGEPLAGGAEEQGDVAGAGNAAERDPARPGKK